MVAPLSEGTTIHLSSRWVSPPVKGESERVKQSKDLLSRDIAAHGENEEMLRLRCAPLSMTSPLWSTTDLMVTMTLAPIAHGWQVRFPCHPEPQSKDLPSFDAAPNVESGEMRRLLTLTNGPFPCPFPLKGSNPLPEGGDHRSALMKRRPASSYARGTAFSCPVALQRRMITQDDMGALVRPMRLPPGQRSAAPPHIRGALPSRIETSHP